MKKTEIKHKKYKTRKAERSEGRGRGVYKRAELESYALFMALPRIDRKEYFGFDTDQDFAKHFELHAGTLTDWKIRPELWEARDKYMIHFKKETAEIMGKLAARTKKSGDAFQALTFMKLVEGYTERTGLDLTSKGQKVTGFNVTIRHAQKSPTTTRDKE